MLTDVAEDLKAGRISPDELPIEYFIYNGQKVTVNNRGLAALTMAGKEPTVTRLVKSTNELMERLAEPAINRFHKMPGYRIPVTLNKDGSGHIYSVFIFRP